MSKVTPIEESELSEKENPHLNQDMSLGEFMHTIAKLDKTLNRHVTIEERPVSNEDSIPDEYIYEVPIDKKKPSRKYCYI